MKNKGEILASVLQNYKDCIFFLHNTRDLNTVRNIMNGGFKFENQLANSTDRINPNDHIEVSYFFFQRKDYGIYTIVIAIPKNIYESYSAFSLEKDAGIEEVISITDPFFSDNDELIYTLSPKHILGYFDIKTEEFHLNKNWDPSFNNSLHRTHVKKPVRPGNDRNNQ